MQESKLLGTLLPAHPDIQPILRTIRKKYNITDITLGDDSSRKFSLSGDEIDWEDVREELDFRIRFLSNLLPRELASFQGMIVCSVTCDRSTIPSGSTKTPYYYTSQRRRPEATDP